MGKPAGCVILVVALGVVCVIGIVWLLFSKAEPFGRNREWDDFHRQVRILLLTYENGSVLRVFVRKCPLEFEVELISGSNNTAEIVLSAENMMLSEEAIENLLAKLKSEGLQPEIVTNDSTNRVLKIVLEVPNIWENSSGDETEGVAKVILEACGVERDNRLDFRYHGRRKWRNRPSK